MRQRIMERGTTQGIWTLREGRGRYTYIVGIAISVMHIPPSMLFGVQPLSFVFSSVRIMHRTTPSHTVVPVPFISGNLKK